MRIACVQMDPLVGDLRGNAEKIISGIEKARNEACDLVIFPELALLGYPPRDILEKRGIGEAISREVGRIGAASQGIGVLFGTAVENPAQGKPFFNAALLFEDGRLLATARKRLLPSYDVFDEERYFEPGDCACTVEFRGVVLGLSICEDIWNLPGYLPRPLYRCDPVAELAARGAQVLVNISASPYHAGKAHVARELLSEQARRLGLQIVYVNQVGGNDELVFQGRAMCVDETGEVRACGADFAEDMVVYDTVAKSGPMRCEPLAIPSEVLSALVLGLRDYAGKCRFTKVVLGLSGGIDSGVTAAVATLALGPENVLGVAMPGPYNAPESLHDARELAQNLGIAFEVVPIGEMFASALATLSPVFSGLPPDVTEENLQSRLRGLILMALSNKFGRLLLSTGNKSELSVGYCTLYGDMNGGLAVLGDIPKTLVYEVAAEINRRTGWIPERTVTRAPSAELRPDQKDEDSLPPYPVLDRILQLYVEERLPVEAIAGEGLPLETVRWVARMVDNNEYKRRQAPPVLRVTTKAFGMGRRFPIAHGYREGAIPPAP